MPPSKHEELLRAEQFHTEGYRDKALNIVNDFEKRTDLTTENLINCFILKSGLLINFEFFDEALNYAEKAYQMSKKEENDYTALQSLYMISRVYLIISNLEKARIFMSKTENLFNQTLKVEPSNKKSIKGRLDLNKGLFHYRNGDFDGALEYLLESLKIFEELDDKIGKLALLYWIGNIFLWKMELDKALIYGKRCLSFQKTFCKRPFMFGFNLMGAIYATTGDLNASIEWYRKGLKSAQDEGNEAEIMVLNGSLLHVYYQQGDFDRCKEIAKKSLKFWEGRGRWDAVFSDLHILFEIFYELHSFEKAQEYLDRMELMNKKEYNPIWDRNIRLAQAMILKIDHSSRNRIKAEDILKQIFEEEIASYRVHKEAFLHFADLLLYEFNLNQNLEVLEHLKEIIIKVLNIAEKQHMYNLMAEIKLLQGKVALLVFEMDDARVFLSEGQKIADDHGLHLLARKISNEHDKLLNELNTWEKLKTEGISLVERIKLTRINDLMGDMVKKRINYPRILEIEQSINLSIFSENGSKIFSHNFTSDSTFDDNIIGNIIIMSVKIGVGPLDRLIFGDFTILLNKFDSFLICYVFKGQSYSAGLKMNNFSESIKENRTIINLLESAAQLGDDLSFEKNSDLMELIINNFMEDSSNFQLPFKAYKGDEPFIFVSYAHSDKLQVYPIMDYLNKSGFNVWYDEGISVSEDWKKSVVKNIEKCSVFLVFITPHIIDSEYVRKEISFALSQKKPFYSVYLKDTKLPNELLFDIGGIQSMKKYIMPESEFYDKIKEVLSPMFFEKN